MLRQYNFIRSNRSAFLFNKITRLNSGIKLETPKKSSEDNGRIVLAIDDKNSSLRSFKLTELIRALFVLKLSTWEKFIKNSEKFYIIGCTFPGKSITNGILKSTFFKQFVAGETENDLSEASAKLLHHGNVKLMICPPMEDIEGVSDNFAPVARENTNRMLEYLEMGNRLNKSQLGQSCVIQYKLTAVFPNESMEIISEDCEKNDISLASKVEEYSEIMSGNEKKTPNFSDKNSSAISMGLRLSAEIFQKANELNIPILIDAELKSTYYAMYAVTLAAASLFNDKKKPKTMIFGTYQCYFRDIKDYVNKSIHICNANNVRFGAKFVRGAYLNKERAIAKEKGIVNPTWDTYNETSENYNAMIGLSLKHLGRNPNSVGLFVASHNLDSILRAIALISSENLSASDPNINFGQIYGMCDHISFALGKQGFNAFKSVPWGCPEELVPYLSRRAAENFTAFQTARNELPMYKEEIIKRLYLAKK